MAEGIVNRANIIEHDSEREIEMVMAMTYLIIKKRRKEMEEKGIQEKDWVKSDIKAVHKCTRCGDRTEKGLKCIYRVFFKEFE